MLFSSLRMRHFLLLLCGLLLTLHAAAQDVLLQTNGEELTGKVLSITPELVTYVGPTADTLRMDAGQVFLIRYANGTKEVLTRPTAAAAPALGLSRDAAYTQGRRDARTHFRAQGAFWGTYAATVSTGYGGVATGLVVSLVRPNPLSFIVPNTELLKNPDYVKGYQRQAQNKKIGSAAGGFGAGIGTLAVVGAVLLSIYGLH